MEIFIFVIFLIMYGWFLVINHFINIEKYNGIKDLICKIILTIAGIFILTRSTFIFLDFFAYVMFG
ncbi:hypothetical protein JJB71_13350 [Clostridium perfringens]|uniref:hypothetical protein n=1 Tax=Clostridium perfringens TaxID=1502 RepID=UPI001ABA857D|nr:hypothetical protein [Clostridium perfringens]MBO3398525.1 hypothetical protein [Clostridium perfringens]